METPEPSGFSKTLYREYAYSVAVYISNISNKIGRIDNFRALALKLLPFLPTELDIFDIRHHFVRTLIIFQRLIC